MALIKITTKPIEYEIKIEHAKLVQKEDALAAVKKIRSIEPNSGQQKLVRRSAEQLKSVAEAEKNSADFQNLARRSAGGRIKATPVNAAIPQSINSLENITELMSQTLSSAQTEQTDTRIYREYSQYEQEMLSPDLEYIAEYSEYEYQGNAEILSFMLDTSQKGEWYDTKNVMEFIPGKFQMEITQYPEVIIEYIGGFQYVPPSSDPDYEEEKQ